MFAGSLFSFATELFVSGFGDDPKNRQTDVPVDIFFSPQRTIEVLKEKYQSDAAHQPYDEAQHEIACFILSETGALGITASSTIRILDTSMLSVMLDSFILDRRIS